MSKSKRLTTTAGAPVADNQIANRAGLLPRLQLVEENHRDLPKIEERIAFSRKHFSV